MAKKDYPVRDDFVKKKKIGPDKLKEVKPDEKTRLMMTLEKLRLIANFIMNIILDFLKRYEKQKPLYEKFLKFIKTILEAAAKIVLWK